MQRTIKEIIHIEGNWKLWKGLGCPSLEKPLVDKAAIDEAVEGLKKLTNTPVKLRFAMGNAALSRLWEQAGENTLDDLKKEERYRIPSPESFLSGVKADKFEIEEAVRDDDKHFHEQSLATKTWRAFRSAINSHLQNFSDTGLGDVELLCNSIEGKPTTSKITPSIPPAFDIHIIEGEELLEEMKKRENVKHNSQNFASPMQTDAEGDIVQNEEEKESVEVEEGKHKNDLPKVSPKPPTEGVDSEVNGESLVQVNKVLKSEDDNTSEASKDPSSHVKSPENIEKLKQNDDHFEVTEEITSTINSKISEKQENNVAETILEVTSSPKSSENSQKQSEITKKRGRDEEDEPSDLHSSPKRPKTGEDGEIVL